jgi:threonine dehydrogenase-like Zn-dependent dehydrogenase
MLGEVEQAEDPGLVGRRVAAEINLACGHCETCLRGLGRHCPNRNVMGILGKDGCFAEHVTLPVRNLHPVPDDVPDEAAVFTEPLAAAYEIPQLVHIDPDDRVLVVGDGKLGLLCALVLRESGCELTVVGHHERKLERMRRLGVRTATPETLSRSGFDYVVEATGSSTGLEYALDRVRPRGTLVLKSTVHGSAQVNTAKIVVDEVRVVGSRCGPFPPALRALGQTRIDPRGLVDATYALRDAVAAFEHAQQKGVLKVILRGDD